MTQVYRHRPSLSPLGPPRARLSSVSPKQRRKLRRSLPSGAHDTGSDSQRDPYGREPGGLALWERARAAWLPRFPSRRSINVGPGGEEAHALLVGRSPLGSFDHEHRLVFRLLPAVEDAKDPVSADWDDVAGAPVRYAVPSSSTSLKMTVHPAPLPFRWGRTAGARIRHERRARTDPTVASVKWPRPSAAEGLDRVPSSPIPRGRGLRVAEA
jgi:hypothetical protein